MQSSPGTGLASGILSTAAEEQAYAPLSSNKKPWYTHTHTQAHALDQTRSHGTKSRQRTQAGPATDVRDLSLSAKAAGVAKAGVTLKLVQSSCFTLRLGQAHTSETS